MFVHGGAYRADQWEYAADYFVRRGFRVIAYDQRGYGRSSKDFGSGWTTLANDLRQVLVQKGVTDITLVGGSLGASVVRRYMGIYGDDLVDKLVVLAVPNPSPPRFVQAELDLFLAGFRQDKPNTFATAIDTPGFLFSPLHFPSEEFRRWVKHQAIDEIPLWILIDYLNANQTEDLAADDASITVCTLIIHGLLDTFHPVIAAIETNASIPGSQLIIYETSSHNPWYEEKDRFHADLEHFAKTCELRPGVLPGLPPLPPTLPVLTGFGPLGPIIEQVPVPPLPGG